MNVYTEPNEIVADPSFLVSLINELVVTDGIHKTMIPALDLVRVSNVSMPLHAIYEPSLLLIAQGSKLVILGNESYRYDSASYLVTSVNLPISGQITQATPQQPFLSVKVRFDMTQILDVMHKLEQSGKEKGKAKDGSNRGLTVKNTSSALLDAVVRLVSLLKTPQDISVVAPLVITEILYRIVQDDHENLIKQFAIVGSQAHAIAAIIKQINTDFSEPIAIQQLAEQANMSTSSLHAHFKKVTAMSPLQYQKLIRLQEARRLLLSEVSDAAEVSYRVGYESPSQFSREYARMYGLPPISDMKRIRAEISEVNPFIPALMKPNE